MRRTTIFEKFHMAEKKSTESGCTEWVGTKYSTGYGRIRNGRKRVSSHRVAWMIYRGEIPLGLCVLHKCDNRACVNQEHLFLGTLEDNVRDMIAKGRARYKTRHGEAVRGAKLTTLQVMAIRQDRRFHREIANSFHVSRSLVHAIKSGRAWRHLLPKEVQG